MRKLTNTKNRIITFIISACMILSSVTGNAGMIFASETETPDAFDHQ